MSNAGRACLVLLAMLAGARALAQDAGHDHGAHAPLEGHPVHDDAIHSFVLLERLEAWKQEDARGFTWSADGWIGTDLDRLWLRSEGERGEGRTHAAHVAALYGRSITAWWDVLAGMRHDFRPGGSRSFAAIGIQGTAPQWFELSAMLHVGGHGQAFVELEAQYELLLTNRLVLQPTLEAIAWRRSDAGRATGSGLATAEAGLRLRYEITRQFAPYLGVVWERSFGNTADLLRAASEPVQETRLVLGLRTWF